MQKEEEDTSLNRNHITDGHKPRNIGRTQLMNAKSSSSDHQAPMPVWMNVRFSLQFERAASNTVKYWLTKIMLFNS